MNRFNSIITPILSLTVAIGLLTSVVVAQPSTNRSLVHNASTSTYSWVQGSTWTGGLTANSSSDFVLLGNGVNDFSGQSLFLNGGSVIGGLNRTIGGFDGSSSQAANLLVSGGGSGNSGILNLAPDQIYQSVLGPGKEIYIGGTMVNTVSNLSSTGELRGNANSSLLNHGTINGGGGVIRNLNLINSASGTIRTVGLAQTSINNSGKIIDCSMFGATISQTSAGEIQAEGNGSWIRGNSVINGGLVNARSLNISIWDSSVANSRLKGNIIGFVNGSISNSISEANQLLVTFNSTQGVGTTVASGIIEFDRIDVSHQVNQGTGQLQINGATLKNRVSQGFIYNQGKIFGTGILENIQVFQGSSTAGVKRIEAQNGAIQFKSSQLNDQAILASSGGFFDVVQGSNFIRRGSVQAGSRFEVRSGATLSLNDLNFQGEVRNQGYGFFGTSGTDISNVSGNGQFVNHANSEMRFFGTNFGDRIDNSGSVTVFQTLTVNELINRPTASVIIRENSSLNATMVSNYGTLIISGTSTLEATTLNNFAGGWILGSGNLNANININQGSILSPGNSPGVLSSGSQFWNDGGKLIFEINNATGLAGVNWDLLSLNGSLNINSTVQNPFLVDITGLNTLNQIGFVTNFNNTQIFSWRVLTAQGGINGFNPQKFSLLRNNFQNNLGGGNLWISQVGNSLYLNFSPVPEPSSVLLSGLLGILGLSSRRRRQMPSLCCEQNVALSNFPSLKF